MPPNRKTWVSLKTLHEAIPESLAKALIKYRRSDLQEVGVAQAELISSHSTEEPGKHLPIIDLDYEHYYWESSPGHAHLYLNVPIGRIRWAVLMSALRFAKVIEPGYYIWSLRRRGNFVRMFPKTADDRVRDRVLAQYGWFRRKRRG